MKISIITVVFNSEETIEDTILSVSSQFYRNIEHIIIDGGSTDGTLLIINKHRDKISTYISEPDYGIYDAMNKGLRLATGDVIGILNSDDIYYDNNVLSSVVDGFNTNGTDSVFSDLVYVKKKKTDKVVRYYRGADFTINKFPYGWMPPHPTFFVKRCVYEKYGYFKTDYIIAADFELLVRFLAVNKVSFTYLPKVFVKMRVGGISTRNLKSNIILNKEIIRACIENGIKTNIVKVMSKYVLKSLQLIKRPSYDS